MDNFLMNTYAPLNTIFIKGNGVCLYDKDNKEYIDLTSGIGVNSLGYGNADYIQSITNQVSNLQHISNIFLNEKALELSKLLAEKSGMSKVFFSNSGAEANECAIKLARKYSSEKYKTKTRGTILTLTSSFHGRTLATLTATGQEKFHKDFFPFPHGFSYVEANNVEAFTEALTSDVCAVMMESIQGEGGVHPLSADFVKAVFELCESHDILTIFDEVQCGIYRTGTLFGYDYFDVKPNIVTTAKGLGGGLPIGAVLCDEKLKDVFKPSDHGSTFGGNPVCCAGAISVLNQLSTEASINNILENSSMIFDTIANSPNSNIIEVRGRGLMIGIQIKGSSSEIQKKALDKGIVVLTAGPNVIRLLPPLVIDTTTLSKALNILLDIINEI